MWNCPTLAIFDELAKQHTAAERAAIVRNRGLFVRELSRAGARILLGTDAGIDVVAPGESVHDELREMVAAGLTPFDALRAGTTSAAEFLGRPDLGRVAVGARADLLLLEGNPLADVANAHRMDGVVLRGAWRPAHPEERMSCHPGAQRRGTFGEVLVARPATMPSHKVPRCRSG